MTKIFLIRHGETAWNAKKRYCGHNDIGLNARGRQQAKKLSEVLKKELIQALYASDRKRAIQTAKIAFDGAKINKLTGLREIHFGRFEGLTHNEVLIKFGEVYQKWLKNPYKNHAPGGEKITDFKKRVVAAFKKIISDNFNKSVVVVCHGGVISAFITHILKTQNFWKHIPRSASISVIKYKDNKPKIILFNDTSHL